MARSGILLFAATALVAITFQQGEFPYIVKSTRLIGLLITARLRDIYMTMMIHHSDYVKVTFRVQVYLTAIVPAKQQRS